MWKSLSVPLKYLQVTKFSWFESCWLFLSLKYKIQNSPHILLSIRTSPPIYRHTHSMHRISRLTCHMLPSKTTIVVWRSIQIFLLISTWYRILHDMGTRKLLLSCWLIKEKGSDPVYKLNTWTLLTPRPLYKINDADEKPCIIILFHTFIIIPCKLGKSLFEEISVEN